MITIVRPRLQRRRARTSRRAWTTSSPSRSPARWPARSQARRPVRSLRELRLPLQLHQLHFRLVTTTALHLIQPLSHLHHKLFNFQFLQTTGRASPLDRDSASPLPPSSVVEAKNRSIILKQEDFVKKKEEPVKKKEEEKKMEKTSSRSGLSCLRPNTLDEDTEAFTRCI